ncbi:MAG: MbnP family protein [Bacteroidota bacterium]
MKKTIGNNSLGLLLGGLLCLGLSACYEDQEGCLDNRATNYDVSADDACGDCCTFPLLQLQVSHAFGDTILNYNDPYLLDGQPFFIRQFIFYISSLQLVNDASSSAGVIDTVRLSLADGSEQTVEDNYTIVSPDFTQFTYNIGTFQEAGTYDSLCFYVGVPNPANGADPVSISSESDLRISSDSLYREGEGYIFNRIQLQVDTVQNSDTSLFEVLGDANLVKIRLPFNGDISLGSNVAAKVRIDYEQWVKGIDFAADTDAQILEKIVNNTPDVFSIIE